MGYDHIQRSPWLTVLLLFVILGLVAAILVGGLSSGMRLLLGVVAVAYYLLMDTFSRLRVRVEDRSVIVSLGRGWPRRVIPLDDVTAVTHVRNKWWYGFGIRRIPSGWMWNVSGLDAVEFRMADKTFTVGTDQPEELLAAVRPWVRG